MSTTNEATTTAPAAQEPVKCGLRPPVADTDFKEKYPPDRELGHELDDTARVWKVYRGEAIDHDDALLKTWYETVNILLTFAGLFSAAVTSFVVASTNDLKPDPNAYVANLLFALGNATAASAFAHLPAPPPLEAAPTSLARVVNGLWFTSLFLSLAAALLCILVKQWLDEYTARTRGSAKHPHEWAQRRMFYFQGLTDWHVAPIISFLPLFLHLALFLFLAGLTAFLWDLDSSIRWVVLVLMLLLLAFYAVSLFLPAWYAACPYATPLLAQLSHLGYEALVIVCLLRRRTRPCTTMIMRLIHRMFRRINSAALPTSRRHRSIGFHLNPRMKFLLELRSLRPFERILRRMANMEDQMPENERRGFAARLDCSSLQWLMHDVSDSDAVAVAWQSLGAFLEEPHSPRSTRMRTIMMDLVKYAGGNSALWRTLRMEGVLDDLQLGRITRSALFIIPSKPSRSALREILYHPASLSDTLYLENALSPDSALIYAHCLTGEHHVVEVVRRLHEQRTHRPLLSTAMFLVNHFVLVPDYSSPEAAIGLLLYCKLGDLPRTGWNEVAFGNAPTIVWTQVAGILRQSCPGRSADPSHKCGGYCVVNALCARALRLIKDETLATPNPRQNSAAPLDAYSHVQLVFRIIRSDPDSLYWGAGFSAAVWRVLTDTRHLPLRIQRSYQIPAYDWAIALSRLPAPGLPVSVNRLYASFATEYNSTWSMLLRGFSRNHSIVILDGCIDFDERVDPGSRPVTLSGLAGALARVTPLQVEITDPSLRYARLRSALTLVESASIALCPMDRPNLPFLESAIECIAEAIPLASLLPTDLALTEEEHTEWVELFISAAQHLIMLHPLPWNDLRDAVTARADTDVKTFFNKVHTRLVELGPCTKGDCDYQGPASWLAALGPVL